MPPKALLQAFTRRTLKQALLRSLPPLHSAVCTMTAALVDPVWPSPSHAKATQLVEKYALYYSCRRNPKRGISHPCRFVHQSIGLVFQPGNTKV
jgi:hypothetical protein